jgi:hypothetical protein
MWKLGASQAGKDFKSNPWQQIPFAIHNIIDDDMIRYDMI